MFGRTVHIRAEDPPRRSTTRPPNDGALIIIVYTMAAWRNACVARPRGRTESVAAAATVKGRLAHMYGRRISYERKETEKEKEKKEKTVTKVHWHKIPG